MRTIVFGIVVILLGASISFAAELDITPKEGELWTSAEGELMIVNMTAVKGAWEELALEHKDGEVIILIGGGAAELYDKVGKKASVTGVLKPRMRYQGQLVRVIEVKEMSEEKPAVKAEAPAAAVAE